MSCEEGRAIQIKIAKENPQKTIDFIIKTCDNISPETNVKLSFMDSRIEKLYVPELSLKNSFEVYSMITIFIALLGLLGLILFQAKKMTKEISIRKIYGAGLLGTFHQFTKEHFQIILISNAIAVPITLWTMHKWLAQFHYRSQVDPFVFIKPYLLLHLLHC